MAGPPVKVEVKGLAELTSGSKRLAEEIERDAGEAFLDVARAAASAVSARVPQRSGRLAASAVATLDANRSSSSVAIGLGVPYAGWVEFGGGRYRGRPYVAQGRYLYPTAEAAAHNLNAAGEHAAAAAIERHHWPEPR